MLYSERFERGVFVVGALPGRELLYQAQADLWHYTQYSYGQLVVFVRSANMSNYLLSKGYYPRAFYWPMTWHLGHHSMFLALGVSIADHASPEAFYLQDLAAE